ncbi:MAG: hypothetical protein HY870_13205 [Chloroflexi bacterium]|nr:hypothetical protein [Chloroflexota bacterium]
MDETGLRQIVAAIQWARRELRWKPGKDIQHLQTRKRHGHLPPDAQLAEYQAIISAVLSDGQAQVYAYHFGETVYPAVVSYQSGAVWLVMVAPDGTLETAFAVEEMERYLTKTEFEQLGLVSEVMP